MLLNDLLIFVQKCKLNKRKKKVSNFLGFSWADNSKCNLSEKNYSIDILIKYMTHELAELRTAVYCSIAMIVAVRKYFPRNSNVIKKNILESFVCGRNS